MPTKTTKTRCDSADAAAGRQPSPASGRPRPPPGASRWSSWSRRRRPRRSPATWAAATSSRPASGTSATCRATPPTCPAAHKGESWARLGVDVDNGFDPLYVVSPDRKQQVSRLKQLVKDASEVYLATDEDREGEAIAWHLVDTLKPTRARSAGWSSTRSPREAIARAVANPRELDTALVDAQETRRILDRLYGYEVCPVLWKKVLPKLSAGRVQSVATRIVVERERERMALHRRRLLVAGGHLRRPGARRGHRRGRADHADGQAGQRRRQPGRHRPGLRRRHRPGRPATSCTSTRPAPAGWPPASRAAQVAVSRVDEKPYRRRPYAPFTTSTLQMEAGRKLGWSSAQVMRIAQRLYENGHITYMRTDSTNLSERRSTPPAPRPASSTATPTSRPRRGATQSKAKGAQEAHEAIRPAGDTFRTPGQLAGQLARDEFRLYELIWQRTVASQMADAVGPDGQHPAGRAVAPPTRPSSSPPAAAPSPSRASCGPTSSAATRAPRATTTEARRRRAPAAPGRARPAAGHPAARRQGPHHQPAGPLHRAQPGRAARGARHRPALDLRLDHADHPGPRVRLEEGLRAGARPSSPSRWSTCSSSTSPQLVDYDFTASAGGASSTRSPAARCAGSTG